MACYVQNRKSDSGMGPQNSFSITCTIVWLHTDVDIFAVYVLIYICVYIFTVFLLMPDLKVIGFIWPVYRLASTLEFYMD